MYSLGKADLSKFLQWTTPDMVIATKADRAPKPAKYQNYGTACNLGSLNPYLWVSTEVYIPSHTCGGVLRYIYLHIPVGEYWGIYTFTYLWGSTEVYIPSHTCGWVLRYIYLHIPVGEYWGIYTFTMFKDMQSREKYGKVGIHLYVAHCWNIPCMHYSQMN